MRRGIVKARRVVWLARPDVFSQTTNLSLSFHMVVFGILFLQRGVAAQIWEGTSFFPASGFGSSLVYFGILFIH